MRSNAVEMKHDVRRTVVEMTHEVRGTASGSALPIMLFLLALTGALAISGVFVARQLLASVRASERSAQVEPAAEGALVSAIAQWDTLQRPLQPIGVTEIIGDGAGGGENTSLWVTRLSGRVYWLVAESRSATRPLLRQRIGVLVRVTGAIASPAPTRPWTLLP